MTIKIERDGMVIAVDDKNDLLFVLAAFRELDKTNDDNETPTGDNQLPLPYPGPIVRDLAESTIHECGEIILRENGNRPMHHRTIADQAMERGYRGRNASLDSTRRSFEQTLRRLSDVFESRGQGAFTLINYDET